MADKKSDAEQRERMHDAFMALGAGLKRLNAALDGDVSDETIRTVCSDHMTAQPEIKKFLESRGLSEFCELDKQGRKELTEHLEQVYRLEKEKPNIVH